MQENASTLSDDRLFSLCREYGANALRWRWKFAGLLPEVHKRHLYEKRGFNSIFEFAAKLAGFSESQVREALNLERRFAEMPALHEALVRGEVSTNKLARVVSVATPQNDAELANQVRLLSNRALETLVRDERAKNENGFSEPKNDQKSLHVHTSTPHLSELVKARLAELEVKGIDINALLTEMLDRREEEIAEEKERVANEQEKSASKRYVPARIRKIIFKEYGTKCAKPTCQRPAQQLHHTNRWAMSRTHDPHYMAPLCREHHQIAHSIDVKYQEKRGHF